MMDIEVTKKSKFGVKGQLHVIFLYNYISAFPSDYMHCSKTNVGDVHDIPEPQASGLKLNDIEQRIESHSASQLFPSLPGENDDIEKIRHPIGKIFYYNNSIGYGIMSFGIVFWHNGQMA